MDPSKLTYLLTVEHAWHIGRAGLLALRPDFSVPDGFPAQRIEPVLINTLDGMSSEAQAQFNLSHFSISSPELLLAGTMQSVSRVRASRPVSSTVWSRSLGAEEDNFLVNRSPPSGQSAGRRLVRPGRSRSPSSIA